MNDQEYPSGWDEKRVKEVIAHYEMRSSAIGKTWDSRSPRGRIVERPLPASSGPHPWRFAVSWRVAVPSLRQSSILSGSGVPGRIQGKSDTTNGRTTTCPLWPKRFYQLSRIRVILRPRILHPHKSVL